MKLKSADFSHIVNVSGVVPGGKLWYHIAVKMWRRVCPIWTDAPFFGKRKGR
jgi:hypothetical protein